MLKQNGNTKTEITSSCLTNRFISIFTTKLDKKIVIVSYSERGHTTYHMHHKRIDLGKILKKITKYAKCRWKQDPRVLWPVLQIDSFRQEEWWNKGINRILSTGKYNKRKVTSNSSCFVKPVLKLRSLTVFHRVKLWSCLIPHFDRRIAVFIWSLSFLKKNFRKVAFSPKIL